MRYDILVMNVQLSTRVTLFLFLGLTSFAIVIITITYANAQLDGFTGSSAESAATMAGASSSSTTPVSGKQFSAILTGENEVPPVDTEATGRIKLIANPQQSTLDYQISLSNLNGIVTGAHIHKGNVGTNGPIVATLKLGNTFAGALASTSGSGGSLMTSTSTGGTISSADLNGPLAGKGVSDLIRLIEDGNTYVNVHTDRNLNGEIRGQLKSSLH
ncbi:MAG TPA: CHRD domain-containing protein [Nitrososphaeraceae archaeon]